MGNQTADFFIEKFTEDSPFFKIAANIIDDQIDTICIVSSIAHLVNKEEFLPSLCVRWVQSVEPNKAISQITDELFKTILDHFEKYKYFQMYMVKEVKPNKLSLEGKIRAIEKVFSSDPFISFIEAYVETDEQKKELPSMFKAMSYFSTPPFVIVNFMFDTQERLKRMKKHGMLA